MTLEGKISEVINVLEGLYEENYDIRDEPQIQTLKKAIEYLKQII